MDSLQKQRATIRGNISRIHNMYQNGSASTNPIDLECRLEILSSYLKQIMGSCNSYLVSRRRISMLYVSRRPKLNVFFCVHILNSSIINNYIEIKKKRQTSQNSKIN